MGASEAASHKHEVTRVAPICPRLFDNSLEFAMFDRVGAPGGRVSDRRDYGLPIRYVFRNDEA